MARIAGVSFRQAGPRTKIAYFFARRHLARLAGRAPERMLEPLEVYARLPKLLNAYAGMEQAAAGLNHLPRRLRLLAELKAATMTACEYCIDLGSQVARRSGLSDDELLALPTYRDSPLFTDIDKTVLDYAVGLSRTPVEAPDALFEDLRKHLDDVQVLELTFVIALENLRGRLNLGLGIGAAGFSAGGVCAAPTRTDTGMARH